MNFNAKISRCVARVGAAPPADVLARYAPGRGTPPDEPQSFNFFFCRSVFG